MMNAWFHLSRRFCLSTPAWISVFLLLLVIPGCGDDSPAGSKSPLLKPSGNLSSHTECKHLKQSTTSASFSDTEGCIEYSYDGQGVLTLTHVNAGFNCCPEEIVAEITIESGVITIAENETAGLCGCLCLFDLDYRIENLVAGQYTIVIKEPYLPDGDDVLEVTVDLEASPAGTYCVPRSGYPWGQK